jgi:hypothetical protein
MGDSETVPPPYITVELETLRRTVLELQEQLAAATTLEACYQVREAAIRELCSLSHYTDMLQCSSCSSIVRNSTSLTCPHRLSPIPNCCGFWLAARGWGISLAQEFFPSNEHQHISCVV